MKGDMDKMPPKIILTPSYPKGSRKWELKDTYQRLSFSLVSRQSDLGVYQLITWAN